MTMHMYGFGKWTSEKPVKDEMVLALARVINHNKQEHKFQPAAFMPTNDADNVALHLALMLDLWVQASDVTVRNAQEFKVFLHHVVDRQGDPADLHWLPDIAERVYPKLEFPVKYRERLGVG